MAKAIETIREGDFVLARDDEGRVSPQRVVRTFAGFCDHLRLVTLVDGDGRSQTLRTTDEHPFWSATIQDWICAGDLEPGMLCEGPNGERLTVESTARQEHTLGVPVYNFEVENAHTYFVQETPESPAPLLVHNATTTAANPCVVQSVQDGIRTSYGKYVRRAEGFKHQLDSEHVRAARREKSGEVVSRKPDGTPYDHLKETREAMTGAKAHILIIKKHLGDPRLSPGDRATIESELKELSLMLDRAEFILGEFAK